VRGVADTLHETRPSVLPPLLDGYVIGDCTVGTPEGVCGGELRATVNSPSKDWWAHCRTCKTSVLVDWWLAKITDQASRFGPRWSGAQSC
jgi:hypothetical protein